MLRARALVVLPVALMLVVLAVRAMVFQSPLDHPLRALQPTFHGHPDALVDGAMREIGAAAATGGAMPPTARSAIRAAAGSAPLAPEPFLVEGTIAQMKGDGPRAEALFLAARLRDPRAPAARYFLADRFFRTNRIAAGLDEMAALARLSEKAAEPLAPALAAYARSPGAIPQLQRFFSGSPANRERTLDLLAGDAANANIVLALAPPLPLRDALPRNWTVALVSGLVTAGNYAAAEDAWRRIYGIRSRGLLHDPEFRDRISAPPFAWQLWSGSAGVAEASGSGGLEVIYYGREETQLARQLVRLAPGSYRLSMRVNAPTSADGVAWTVTCAAAGDTKFLQLPLAGARKGVLAAVLNVPPGSCPVQWIELRGRPGPNDATAQLTISDLQLEPLAATR